MKLGKKAQHLKTINRPPITYSSKNEFINLSNNEASFGPYKRYPYTYPLYETLSRYFNVDIDNVLPVRGAEEGLKVVFDVFVEEGMRVVRPNPTFGMIEVYEQLNKAKSVKIEYKENRMLDLNLFIKKINKNSFIYIANPDNPTGTHLSQGKLQLIINEAKRQNALVLLDETYKVYNPYEVGFKDEENVVTVGSFSKSHGLAGIRLGYVIANKEIIDILRRIRPMEEVNSIAVEEGIKLVNSKTDIKNVKQVKKWKKIFKKKFPQNYIETATNFILLRFKGQKNISLYERLYENKILTRADFTHPSMRGMLRITIGRDSEMKKVLKII